MSNPNNATVVRMRPDCFKSVTSTVYGANHDIMAFNMGLIEKYDVGLALRLASIYSELPLFAPDLGEEEL
jgi:hypothetical protein